MVVVVIMIVKTMEMTKMGALDMMTVKMTMANMMMTVISSRTQKRITNHHLI